MIKSAIVVGGSSGIGLSIVKNLLDKGYNVIIIDKQDPLITFNNTVYYYCDLTDYDEDLFDCLKKDNTVEILMITAGIGRVTGFENIHISEIQNTIDIDLTSTLKIISSFYDNIMSKKKFYCGVMGSIAGLISSPLFSVYSAAKAGIYRFIESVNIELEKNGTSNRILNVSPGSINGTGFNGKKNDISMTNELAEQIVEKLFASETLFIPEYQTIFKGVLERYYSDPHEYGLYSYSYKMSSGRVSNCKKIKIGYLSGTFDLFHIGHLNLLKRAKQQCDYLIVGVHPTAAHKGKEAVIPFEDRKEIVKSCKYVNRVIDAPSEDNVAWKEYQYDILFVGSDYLGTERFERYEIFFSNKNVEIVYLPYTDKINSTELREIITNKE